MFLDKYIDGGWILAIRPRIPGQELFTGCCQRSFKLIHNPWRYWCADPFLFEYQGKTYIFCEAFDILKDRGVIAYRTIDQNGHVSQLHPCLDTEFHLSYPNVFSHNGQVYMIPETGAADQVQLYRAVAFPDKWEKQAVLLEEVAACDANLLHHQDNWYLQTLIYDKKKASYTYDSLYTYVWKGNEFYPCTPAPSVQGAQYARNAGKTFFWEGNLYRVSQNCAEMYGESITFHKVSNLSPEHYEEKSIRQIYVGDISVNSRKGFEGIHTYNANEDYEVVDLQRKKWFRIERFVYLAINKLRNFLK